MRKKGRDEREAPCACAYFSLPEGLGADSGFVSDLVSDFEASIFPSEDPDLEDFLA
jgi:hypothetical protein